MQWEISSSLYGHVRKKRKVNDNVKDQTEKQQNDTK